MFKAVSGGESSVILGEDDGKLLGRSGLIS